MKKLVLIDSHALVHRAFHALPPTLTSPQGVPTNAVYGFTSVLLKMLKDLRPDYIAAAFDLPGATFRHDEFQEYKSTRVKAPDELYAQVPLVQQMVKAFGIPVFEHPGYEADDIIGSLAEQAKKTKDLQVIIVTGDLDTLQLVDAKKVVVFTLRKGVTDTVVYDEKSVKERYGLGPEQVADFKGLKGDPSDNIPGVPGIGDKTASTLIQQFGSIEKLYEKLEEKSKHGLSEKLVEKLLAHKDQAFFSKRLATIVTNLDISFSLKDAQWQSHIDRDTVTKTLKDFGFYSLTKRLDEILTEKTEKMALSETDQDALPPLLAWHGDTLVAHDAKPHLKELIKDRKSLPTSLFDTRIAAYLIKPDDRNYDFEKLVHEYRVSTTSAEQLRALQETLRDILKSKDLTPIFSDIEMPLMPVLAQMELHGITVDPKIIAVLQKKAAGMVAALERKIYGLAGMEFNISSPKQLSQVLFEKLAIQGKVRRTGGGAPSTAAPELEKLRDGNPIIDHILEYREIQKLLSTYIEPFPTLIGPDGRIHTTYNQTGAATGRLASENPNLQNIPVKTDLGNEFRRAFVAPKGWKLVSFDYSQLELRIVAHIAQDAKMIAAFKRGQDIHTRTAVEILGVKPEEITKDMRRMAKVLNFGLIYGMGALGFARAAGVDRNQARQFIDRYFQEFSGVAAYMEAMKQMAYTKGFVQTIFGRRRPLPDARSSMPQLRAQAERMAINHPVQGTEADLIKLAMISIAEYLKKEGLEDHVHMLLQVHDELVFEMSPSAIGTVVPKIKSIMESAHRFDVPIVVDVKTGTNWSDMEALV